MTGAGQGVGQGIALALADAGARLVIAGRTESKLLETAEIIQSRGGQAITIPCDVEHGAEITACIDQTVAQFGGLDIMVNNAQTVPLGPLLNVTEEAFKSGWASGPLAAFRFMRACYPHMKERGGSIINLATAAAMRWDAAGYGAYAAVKEAIRSLTRAAACEWGADNIRVNTVIPLALSPGMKYWMEANPEESAAFVKLIPLQRVGDCETDIGQAVAFLASSEAQYITGATIPIDGGQVYIG